MALTAFLDDSGSEPQSQHFVLAGFVSAAEQWAEIADCWQSVCHEAPRIEYFKMVEAAHLRGQFGGWTPEARDLKVIALSAVIPKYTVIQLCAHMRNEDFSHTIKGLPIYNKQKRLLFEHPYLTLWYIIVSKFYVQWQRMGFLEPVNFLFDQQLGFESHATEMFESMRQMAKDNLAPDFYNLLASSPRFADDKDEVPLQLADMHAWAVRRQLSLEDVGDKMPYEALKNFEVATPMTLNVTREYLEYLSARMKSGSR